MAASELASSLSKPCEVGCFGEAAREFQGERALMPAERYDLFSRVDMLACRRHLLCRWMLRRKCCTSWWSAGREGRTTQNRLRTGLLRYGRRATVRAEQRERRARRTDRLAKRVETADVHLAREHEVIGPVTSHASPSRVQRLPFDVRPVHQLKFVQALECEMVLLYRH